MAQKAKSSKLLRKQAPMRKVLLGLLPCIGGSIYFFGWRSLVVILVSCLVGFAGEFYFCRKRGEPVSEACFVTAVLYALIMPPSVPWHVVVVGMLFSIVVTKELFGGFGRNIFNPAMAGRAFVYICFPIALTASAAWIPAAQGTWGALGQWTTAVHSADAVTAPSPMTVMKLQGEVPKLTDLFFGRVSGSMGVTSALLILIGGIYLFVTKTANRTLILVVIGVYAAINELLFRVDVKEFHGALPALLGGGFLLGAFFMVTDPVSSPKTGPGRVIYAVIIAVCTAVIRNYSIFNGGLMFSIMLGNTFASIIDFAVKEHQKARQERAKAKAAEGQGSGQTPGKAEEGAA